MISKNTSIVLNIHEPKKTAVVATPGVSAEPKEVRIWAAVGVNPALTQSIIGDFIKLHRMAQTQLKNLVGVGVGNTNPDILHMPLGGSDNDITINGVPTADEVRLEVGSYTGKGDRSHFLDRTFKRLLERWLEASK